MANFQDRHSHEILRENDSFCDFNEETSKSFANRSSNWQDNDMEQFMKKFQNAQEKLVDDSGEEDQFENNDCTSIMSLFYQVWNVNIYL